MLSLAQINDVCLHNHGAYECRYLERDKHDHRKFYCRKKSADAETHDELVEEYVDECKASGEDPWQGFMAIGDNCPGFWNFSEMLQGYDV